MILVRAWIRQALGASGAAVAVPAAMLGVLALLTLSGGLGRIGNIGQAFSGPRLPATVVPTPSSASRAGPRPDRLLATLGNGPAPAVASAPAHTPGKSAPGSAPSPSGGSGQQGGSGGSGGGSGGTGGPAGGAPPAGGSGGTSTGPADPSPSHRPSPGPSLVTRVTDTAASAASRLPGPLGPAAEQTIETVGSAAGAVVQSGAQVPVQAPNQAVASLPALASGG
jgi:hypothetical protein